MNPLIYPKFWLSLAFIIVVGLVILPPIRQRIQKFFKSKKSQIETEIKNAQEVYKEALTAHQKIQKELRKKQTDKELAGQIKNLKNEFDEKIATYIQLKKQDFQMRQNLMLLQMKEHIRQALLDKVEDKIKASGSKKITDKEIAHFIKMLNENASLLKKSLEE